MAKRVPASIRTLESLSDLIEGRLSSAEGRAELAKLATRLIVEEALEAESRDALGRDYNEHSASPGQGWRNGVRMGRLKTAEGLVDYAAPQIVGRDEPFRSEIRKSLKGRTQALEDLAVELLARGLSVRDIEDAFRDESGRLLKIVLDGKRPITEVDEHTPGIVVAVYTFTDELVVIWGIIHESARSRFHFMQCAHFISNATHSDVLCRLSIPSHNTAS